MGTAERMTAADAAALLRDRAGAPAQVGGIAVFTVPAGGFDYDRLSRLVSERIALAPRYRQKVRTVPANLATPVWVDDADFDLTYHLRRSALPRPGSDDQLFEFAARVLARPLDRHRPLWEMYLVEGLSGGRFAVVTKTHEAMVDERGGIDLSQVILDASPAPRRAVVPAWEPAPEPSAARLVREAVLDLLRHPLGLTETARATARDAEQVSRAVGAAQVIGAVSRALFRSPAASPLQVRLSEQRRVAVARTRLADYRTVRSRYGGTVNDVVLAVVTGAVRGWLLMRGELLMPTAVIRALVPVSVTPGGQVEPHPSRRPADPGPAVRPLLVDLPVGQADPVARLAQLRYAMSPHTTSVHAVGAETIATLGGFAPPTLHLLGSRAAAGLGRRLYGLTVTNVPGPQQPLYAAGARMTEMFPILPLTAGHALSIALTSYDSGVYLGLNADRDAVRDVGLIAGLIEDGLNELVELAGQPIPNVRSTDA